MRYRVLLMLALLALGGKGMAQSSARSVNVPFDQAHVADAAQLKAALAAIRKGDELAFNGGVDHAAAIAAYQQAMDINPDNAELNCKVGVCLLNGPMPASALPLLQRAAVLDPALPRVHYLLGYALQLNARWAEAIAAYQRHAEIIRRTPDPDRTYNMVEKRVLECRSGMELMNAPAKAMVSNIGGPVNSPAAEYGALLDGKGNLYFTSRRPQTTGGKLNKVNNSWFEDVFHSSWGAQGWSTPQPLAGLVNGPRNDATVSLSPDGRRMVVYRDERNGGDLYTTDMEGSAWSQPVPMPPVVNSPAQESSAWRSADGNWLYFVSSREGGFGGSDIYRCPWDWKLASWGAAENLGPDVNTMYDEEGVYAPGDGSTIYFASQGHSSMGGYDLFKASFADGRWSRPENLGWPINSPGDDQFLVLMPDGNSGYFSSVRPGGMGEDDIYRVDFTPVGNVEATALLATMGTGVPMAEDEEERLRLIGFIKGLRMMEPVEAVVALMSLNEPEVYTRMSTDPSTGRYAVEVPPGKEYAVHVTAKGYLPHSERLEGKSGDLRMDMALTKIAPGNAEVLRNIFYKPQRFELDSSSTKELSALCDFLKTHPDLRLQIGGHADSDVGPISNKELSESRAREVVNWLVKHGIAADRLEAKGFGDSKPIAPNDSDSNKALNRRTEIMVL